MYSSYLCTWHMWIGKWGVISLAWYYTYLVCPHTAYVNWRCRCNQLYLLLHSYRLHTYSLFICEVNNVLLYLIIKTLSHLYPGSICPSFVTDMYNLPLIKLDHINDVNQDGNNSSKIYVFKMEWHHVQKWRMRPYGNSIWFSFYFAHPTCLWVNLLWE